MWHTARRMDAENPIGAERDAGTDDTEAARDVEPAAETIDSTDDVEDGEHDDSGVAAVAALLVGLLGFLGAVAFVLLRRALFNV